MIITTKNQAEYKFLFDLLEKLHISWAKISEEELEDLCLAKMMKSVNKTKKTSKESVMQKLKS